MNEQNHMTKVQEFKGQSEGPSLYKSILSNSPFSLIVYLMILFPLVDY